MQAVIRVDASRQIGTGHVIRCLALAEALRDLNVTVEFITRDHPGNLNNYIRSKNFKVHTLHKPVELNSQQELDSYEQWLGVKQIIDAEESIQVLANAQVSWLIVDHYALDYSWEKKLRPYASKIMVIDDLANRRHECDLLLDQNYIRDRYRYDSLLSPDTIKLLGPKFALLRKHFATSYQSRKSKRKSINRVFIFFGGSDPNNLTTTALRALTQPDLQDLSVDVAISSTNPHQAKVKEFVEKHPNVELYIQVENIAKLMAKADIALGGGGSTTWERMAVGLPSIVVTIAENQIALTKNLSQDGYLNWLGNEDQINECKIHDALLEVIQNPFKLHEQSRKGQQLVDGMGAERVGHLLTVGPNVETLTVHKAKASDYLLYWYWANDVSVRENSFNQKGIPLEDHQIWFNKNISDPDTILLLISCEYGPIGQVRFERSGEYFTIGYSLARQFRGFGLSKPMLTRAIDHLRGEQTFTLIGDVKETNPASIKVFEQLGFSESIDSPQTGVRRFQLECFPTK